MAATTVRIANFMGTGVDLLPLPSSPGYREVQWSPTDATTSNISPYTRQEQVQAWAGGDYWAATVTLPILTRVDAANWAAKLMGARGALHAFQVGDQLYQGPQNPYTVEGSSPVVDGGQASIPNAPGQVVLATKGWLPGTPGVLTVGDYLQVGYRLYRSMSNVDSDANGNASIVTWPSLRETPPDGSPIDVISPVGIFRRAENALNINTNFDGTTSISFKIVEVR